MTDEELIEKHIAEKGITVCPPVWAEGAVFNNIDALAYSIPAATLRPVVVHGSNMTHVKKER